VKKLFGPVMQNAFVVEDLEASIHQWASKLGVGPFYVFEHVQFSEILFRGKPAQIDMTGAIAYWGDLQIELVIQHNDTPSIYREFRQRGLRGMQHMGVMTDDLDAHLERLKPLDIAPVQRGQVAGGGPRFAYINSDFSPGTMIELIEAGDSILGFFKTIQEASRKWDGRNPIVRV
jgi:methylmalonyl-CoA/ethylmalonyl-CoA epimerase